MSRKRKKLKFRVGQPVDIATGNPFLKSGGGTIMGRDADIAGRWMVSVIFSFDEVDLRVMRRERGPR